jgi:hypothetical protein
MPDELGLEMMDEAGTKRPWLFRGIRVLEGLGLLTLLYGLASSLWLVAAAGVIVILTSYRIYRRWFPVMPSRHDSTMGQSDGGD